MPLRILQLGPYKNVTLLQHFIWNFPCLCRNIFVFPQGEITIDNAIKYALKKTKLQDLGSADFAKAYRRLTDTPIHKDQEFSNLGYISARMEMNLSVARRIRLVEFFKKFPNVLEIPVRSPVFVLGLVPLVLNNTCSAWSNCIQLFIRTQTSPDWYDIPSPPSFSGSCGARSSAMGAVGFLSRYPLRRGGVRSSRGQRKEGQKG